MNGESSFASTPVPWALMLQYERADVVLQLLRQFSFFDTDKLILTEREEVICSAGMHSEDMNYLVIHGAVGNARKDVFLKLLRLARLTLVQDMASQVVVCPQIGDLLPNAMLHSLWETGQVRGFRKWNCIYWAMKCGLLRKIKRRREMIQVHVEQILNSKAQTVGRNAPEETIGIGLANEESFYKSFRDLLDLEQEEQNAPLEMYHTAFSEKRVNLSTAIATVPSLIVLWASWDAASMGWMREHIFNVTKTLRAKTTPTLGLYLKYDPWLETVMQFVHVPQRIIVTKRRMKKPLKRAQIVLISVDREKFAACEALNSLVNEVSGWQSPEVPLIPLWCGPDGLQSDLAMDLNIAVLPFFVATQLPDNKTRKFGDGGFPRICYITSNTEGDLASDVYKNTIDKAPVEGVERLDWHDIEEKERKSAMSVIRRFLDSSDAPLRFVARVDRTYQIDHTSAALVTSCPKPEVSSFVSMSGIISTPDLLKLKEGISVLSQVRNFFLEVKVMRPSCSIIIQLNTKTPTRYALGSERTIACSECLQNILIDKEHHFRCIHCDQSEGVLCRVCFAAGKHPHHHVLLRIPTCSETTLPLLWGPSNVSPLDRFCGTLLSNVNETHIGVYCNVCSHLICGVRWKCAICYQYDLCDRCDEKRSRDTFRYDANSSSASTGLPSPVNAFAPVTTHPKDHLFLCIRHGCGVDGDACLSPVMEQGSMSCFMSHCRTGGAAELRPHTQEKT
ncbi:putative beta prime cop protein [Trypanosoma rangeli]|uniref:Putative beta prime cop protein n=1 Tax=Trypanosoma rangeli TaxID=5698 RepID=A0A422NEI4_TRYRA|nr:putative beta prime cop protein [Trypanosoma rangeli]RNF03867.1 putative beta prime cop protein [Trypanosoma rangeli]|eukprot:RNF03867.1 putative beta prime cop protein [Trypanosoma rangeli]